MAEVKLAAPSFTHTPDPAVRLLAWAGVVVGSSLAEIIAHLTYHRTPTWLGCVQVALLTVAGIVTLRTKGLRGVGRFLLAVAALRLCWYLLAPNLADWSVVRRITSGADWGERLFIARSLPLAGALLMAFTLVGNGATRRTLFLRIGDLTAPAQPIRFLGLTRSVRWTVFGPVLLIVFGIALPLFLYFTVRPDFRAAHRIVEFLPWIIATALLNAANEEFQFRCVLLAHLRSAVTAAEAVLMTAVLFGIGHYFGQPSGPIGVLMAGFAGWIWARSMVETGGAAWAFIIHMVQDVVIFSFLALAAK